MTNFMVLGGGGLGEGFGIHAGGAAEDVDRVLCAMASGASWAEFCLLDGVHGWLCCRPGVWLLFLFV